MRYTLKSQIDSTLSFFSRSGRNGLFRNEAKSSDLDRPMLAEVTRLQF